MKKKKKKQKVTKYEDIEDGNKEELNVIALYFIILINMSIYKIKIFDFNNEDDKDNENDFKKLHSKSVIIDNDTYEEIDENNLTDIENEITKKKNKKK